jgi:hypothetical protein
LVRLHRASGFPPELANLDGHRHHRRASEKTDVADRRDAEVRWGALDNLVPEPPDACLAARLPDDPGIPALGQGASVDAALVVEAILPASGIPVRAPPRGAAPRALQVAVGAKAALVADRLALVLRTRSAAQSRQLLAELLTALPGEA